MSASRKVIRVAGGAMAAVSLAFVLFRVAEYRSQLDLNQIDKRTWYLIVICSLSYGFANAALALAWVHLLKHFRCNTSPLIALHIYGVTQIAKYTPGNVFHIASRQVLGLNYGLDGWAMAKAAVWEILLIAATGSIFAGLVVPGFLFDASAAITLLIFATCFALFELSIKTFFGASLFFGGLYQGLFLMISGLVFSSLLFGVSDETYYSIPGVVFVTGAFVLAWLAGFVTPGAPAGLGVREVVLLALLGNMVPQGELLQVILMSRLVTVFGDTIFFLGSYFLKFASEIRQYS